MDNQLIKIRHKNWYWGKYIFSGESLNSNRITLKDKDFEIYEEEKHGWHNSEEFKKQNEVSNDKKIYK